MQLRKHLFSAIRKLALSYCVLLALFTGLIILVYCIPPSLTYEHVIESAPYQIADENAVVEDDAWTTTSSGTVGIMLTMASHGGERPAKDAMEGGWYLSPSTDIFVSTEEGIGKKANQSYERYWNGWMVFVRPLLILFNYGGIKKLSWIAFFVLFVSLVILAYKKLGNGALYAGALGISLIAVCPNGIDQLAYIFPILLALGACIFVFVTCENLHSPERRLSLSVAFFVIGALTQYLDFLTFPALTLLYPLFFCVLLINESKGECKGMSCGKTLFFVVAFSSITWCLGYGLLWGSKWVVGSLILGRDIVSDSFNQMLFRTGVTNMGFGVTAPLEDWFGTDINAYNSIAIQLKTLYPGMKIWMLVLTAIVLLVLLAVQKLRGLSCAVPIALLAIALMPYVWFAVASNHSIIHYYFTYRLQAASLFGLLAYLVYSVTAIGQTWSWKKPLHKSASPSV